MLAASKTLSNSIRRLIWRVCVDCDFTLLFLLCALYGICRRTVFLVYD